MRFFRGFEVAECGHTVAGVTGSCLPSRLGGKWLEWAPAARGWTSGLSELVNDSTAAEFDHRVDMVFGRTASGGSLAVDRGEATGTDVADRDPATGLWPSDHGGVVLRLRGL